jgi:Phosphotransferase enzyme family
VTANVLSAPAAAQFHRREWRVSEALAATGLVPRLLDGYDDGTWVALVFEDIDGRVPAQPWRPEELDRVLDAVEELAHALTPAPVDPTILAAPRLGGWRELARQGRPDALHALNPWAARHLDDLVELEQEAHPAIVGRTLLHGDLYPFNVLLTAQRVVVVDWPHAWIGAAHCDAVTLMSGAALSGIDPQPLAERHPLTRYVDPAAINSFLALGRLRQPRQGHHDSVNDAADRSPTDQGHLLIDAGKGWRVRAVMPTAARRQRPPIAVRTGR